MSGARDIAGTCGDLDHGTKDLTAATVAPSFYLSQIDINTPEPNDRIISLLAAIVDSSDDAIVSKTLDGIITSWNRGAEKIFGYRAEEAIGRHITLIIPTERHNEENDVLARVRRGENSNTSKPFGKLRMAARYIFRSRYRRFEMLRVRSLGHQGSRATLRNENVAKKSANG